MEEFSIVEWIEKVKQDPKQLAIPIIIVLTIVFLGYKVLYAPKKIELAKQEKRNKSLIAETKNLSVNDANKEEIEKNIKDIKKQFEQSTKFCYKKNEMTSFLRHIRDLASNAGIIVKSINPKPFIPFDVGNLKVEALPVSFKFEGDVIKLGIFLRMLEIEEKITFLKLPKLVANKEGKFNLNLEPTVVIIPDDFSLERIMAENSSKSGEEEEFEDDYE